MTGPACCAKGLGAFLKDGKPTYTNPKSTVSASGTATSNTAAAKAASSSSAVSTAHKQTGWIIGEVIGGVAGLTIIVLAFRFLAIQQKMRAHTPPQEVKNRARSNLSYYNGMGWGPVEAPTYAGDCKRQELESVDVERQEMAGNSSWEKG